MRKRAADTRVEVIIASDGRHSVYSEKVSAYALAEIRQEEARRAAAVLGLSGENIVFLPFEDGRLTDNRQTRQFLHHSQERDRHCFGIYGRA